MAGELNIEEIRRWVHAKPNLVQRTKNRLWRFWYHRIKNIPEGRLTVTAIIRGILKLLALVGIFAAPYWTELFKPNPAYSSEQLAYMTAVLVVLLFISWLTDTFSFNRKMDQKKKDHLERFASRHHVAIDEIQKYIYFDEDNEDQRHRLTQNVLSCILELVKGQIGEYDAQYFEANLLVLMMRMRLI